MKCSRADCTNEREPGSLFCSKDHDRCHDDTILARLQAERDINPTRELLLLGLMLNTKEQLRQLAMDVQDRQAAKKASST